eukprot:TRINITY_DN9408_c0_g2_i1.p1 TRINITY_DN9408_c0_g2~~TRINITY_DN9408_c0_g2_i1.p1  ORF type:complete len:277 (+),score=32.78 TRINITY_DN9408_c0_g2_i1:560-1390(+)
MSYSSPSRRIFEVILSLLPLLEILKVFQELLQIVPTTSTTTTTTTTTATTTTVTPASSITSAIPSLSLLEATPRHISELSQESRNRLQEVQDSIEYNDIKDLAEKLQLSHSPIKIKVTNIYRIITCVQRKMAHVTASQKLFSPKKNAFRRFYGNDLFYIDRAICTDFLASRELGNKITGKFGKGIYFTSDSTTSVMHSGSHDGCILLCEIFLGRFWTIHCPMGFLTGEEVSHFGYDSVYGLRNSEKVGGVEFDQFVLYNGHQALPLYYIGYERVNK